MHRHTAILLLPVALASLTAAEDGPFRSLNLEAHGFASFGWLKSWGNDWLGPSRDHGTTELWETAVNAIARPADRLRLGVQLFARDLGNYDNGRVQLDWAYADWRADDACGIQVGRVKTPIGLANETLDVDAARTPVFLPPSIYALRSRDLYISFDGAKLYGFSHLGGAGRLDYAAYAGAKRFDPNGGFATYMAESGLGDTVDCVHSDWMAGGMVHWATPVSGLGFRLSGANLHDFAIDGSFTSGMSTRTEVGNFYTGFFSAIYETASFTVQAEYARVHGRGETRIDPWGLIVPLVDNSDGAYASTTWHCTRWLDLYLAYEIARSDACDRSVTPKVRTWVGAISFMPLSNWSLKAEFRDNHGTLGASNFADPGVLEDRWQALALKTTVDF